MILKQLIFLFFYILLIPKLLGQDRLLLFDIDQVLVHTEKGPDTQLVPLANTRYFYDPSMIASVFQLSQAGDQIGIITSRPRWAIDEVIDGIPLGNQLFLRSLLNVDHIYTLENMVYLIKVSDNWTMIRLKHFLQDYRIGLVSSYQRSQGKRLLAEIIFVDLLISSLDSSSFVSSNQKNWEGLLSRFKPKPKEISELVSNLRGTGCSFNFLIRKYTRHLQAIDSGFVIAPRKIAPHVREKELWIFDDLRGIYLDPSRVVEITNPKVLRDKLESLKGKSCWH